MVEIIYKTEDGLYFFTEKEARDHEDSLVNTKLRNLVNSLNILKEEKPKLQIAAYGYTKADVNIAFNNGVYAVITALYNKGYFKEFLQNG